MARRLSQTKVSVFCLVKVIKRRLAKSVIDIWFSCSLATACQDVVLLIGTFLNWLR